MILVPANKVEKIKYFSTLLGLIFIEITRGPLNFHDLRPLNHRSNEEVTMKTL